MLYQVSAQSLPAGGPVSAEVWELVSNLPWKPPGLCVRFTYLAWLHPSEGLVQISLADLQSSHTTQIFPSLPFSLTTSTPTPRAWSSYWIIALPCAQKFMKGLVSLGLRGSFFLDFFPLVQAPGIPVAKKFSGYDPSLEEGHSRWKAMNLGSALLSRICG